MKKSIFFSVMLLSALLVSAQSPINCTALKSGCRILQSPPSFAVNDPRIAKITPWSIEALVDENGSNGWRSSEKTNFPMTFVFELSEDFFLEKLIFNNNCSKSTPGVCAREVKIEVSASGPETGYKETSVYILKENAVSEFGVSSVGARWIRMTIVSNYGHKDFVELMEFSVMGKFVDPAPGSFSVKGVWNSNLDWVSLNTNDSGYVYGCFKRAEGELYSGKIDRKIYTFNFTQKEDGRNGWTILTLGKESMTMSGIWGYENDHSQFGYWELTKKGDVPNPCGNDQAVKEIKPDSAQSSFPPIKDDRLSFKIQLVDYDTRKAVEGKITISSDGKMVKERNTYNGASSFQVNPEEKNNLSAKGEAPGYLSSTQLLDSSSLKEPVVVLTLKKLEAGKSVVLDHIQFEKGKFELLPQSYEELDKLVQIMKEYPQMVIEISGHTDNQGDPKKNVVLSEHRVRSVKNYLVSKGIKASRISGVGYGGTRPIASNGKEETRKLNRRVEFKIIKM